MLWMIRDLQPLRARTEASLFGVALLASLLAASSVLAQEDPALVQVDEVRTEPLSQTAPVLGRIVTEQQGVVATRVAGPVERVDVQVGDRVAAGDPLVWLDSEPLDLERNLAAAEYDAALAQQAESVAEVDLLESERERLLQLRESAAFSKAQLEDKENQITVANSRIQAATARTHQYRAKLELKARDLADATIRAPYAGVITMRHVSPGAYLRVGDPVVTMIDHTNLEIEADVPSDQLAGIEVGTTVGVTLDDRTEHSAEVRAIVPEDNPLTRTRAVRFKPQFGETEKPLAIGQSVTLELPIGLAREVLTVSKDGVIQRPDGAVVFLVEDQVATPRPVQLGSAVGGRFEVLGGLEHGDLVVIRGNERLQSGQAVTYPGAPHAAANDTESES